MSSYLCKPAVLAILLFLLPAVGPAQTIVQTPYGPRVVHQPGVRQQIIRQPVVVPRTVVIPQSYQVQPRVVNPVIPGNTARRPMVPNLNSPVMPQPQPSFTQRIQRLDALSEQLNKDREILTTDALSAASLLRADLAYIKRNYQIIDVAGMDRKLRSMEGVADRIRRTIPPLRSVVFTDLMAHDVIYGNNEIRIQFYADGRKVGQWYNSDVGEGDQKSINQKVMFRKTLEIRMDEMDGNSIGTSCGTKNLASVGNDGRIRWSRKRGNDYHFSVGVRK